MSVTEQERKRIGETIRTLREARGLSQEQLAHAIFISRPYISMIESGAKQITPILVAKIADALAVPQIAIVRDGYFNRDEAEALAESRKLERRIEKLQETAKALAADVAGIEKNLADLLARAKAVA
ncbi:helix-turn-helix domain-containing protein [Actinomyces culturomici]|uniref:helix-turn-helix domain-containing protein n=1 Tax=Actinomyces culturomici TaxID=1926276 RepID=UPI000E2041F4|nr:helix-turn-helix domain-containing protein [Actinomyces culturomici]